MNEIVVDLSKLPAIYTGSENVKERKRRSRRKFRKARLDRVAVLDMETDPFDTESQERIFPFTACIYSNNFEPIIIWEEDEARFCDALISEIETLPDSYTIYAHNGGKFDFMFLVSRLRGRVAFKGRGIMSATIGRHELRDSFHIIPEKLAAYAKDKFDYQKMRKNKRNLHRDEIVRYLVSDCKNLLEIVTAFLDEYGFKISIGQAAMAELKKQYKVKSLSEAQDRSLRQFFFGGRVQCIEGKGRFDGDFKLYDVNSMYPHVMAVRRHPIGNEYIRRRGAPNSDTVFIELECQNYGALVRRSPDGETISDFANGRYFTTIWEYEIALRYGLIEDVRIIACIDNLERTTFERFIMPLYTKREKTKQILSDLADKGETETEYYAAVKRENIFLKLIQNNAYGKFAQNPRRFKEYYITDPGKRPPTDEGDFGLFPESECADYTVWSRPNPERRFNNVGTAASITGAARAVLLEAMQNATNPIYCDTDSLICTDLQNVNIHKTELGAWDIEKRMSSVLIAGKKLYAYREKATGKESIKSKGAAGLKWNDMLKLLAGEILETINPAPTMTRNGRQFYMKRRVRATAKERQRNGEDITAGKSRKSG